MRSRPPFAAAVVALCALTLIAAPAPAVAGGKRPSFDVVAGGSVAPRFRWGVRDYAARCEGDALTLRVSRAPGWRAKLPGSAAFSSTQRLRLQLGSGEATTLTFRRDGRPRRVRFHIRCLPPGFPDYEFERVRAGGPELLMTQLADRYAVIFSRGGAPVWWMQSDTLPTDAKVLPDGTVSWAMAPFGSISGSYGIRSFDGNLLRTVGDPSDTDLHDLQLLPNGNYLIGREVFRDGVDASAFGGAADATVLDYVIAEVKPSGRTVRSWSSAEHIGLAETGRWWPQLTPNAIYDVVHWNAVDAGGRYMYLSFRHLDAIYKVDRFSGEIVWKLGGTPTPRSLDVRGDQLGSPLGAQHDVRVQPDGSVTVFDNRSGLDDAVPRAVRFRVDERRGTAKLVESISDPEIASSRCCGSARRLPSGDWLVAWGSSDLVGAYDERGRPLFRLRAPGAFTYRANPVPEGIGIASLRAGMDRMSG